MENAKPTGCYKCGRPGHWSRDCPSSATTQTNSTNANLSSSRSTSFNFKAKPNGGGNISAKSTAKPKKVPKSRPKLTPELLLSDDGLGYILRHFPSAFKYGGRGREVRDLDHLIGLYSEWHSHLLPYYSFDQFVHKVEQVAATKRVKICIRDLRERVSSGGDPTKLHEPPTEQNDPTDEQEAMNTEGLSHHRGDTSPENHAFDNIQEDMLHEVCKKASEEPSRVMLADDILRVGSSRKCSSNQVPDEEASCSSESQITEKQRARMEANRLKALERAAARAQSRQAA
ncbi:zf-CCHC domain-containing protein/Swi3 domain-containing protein [Cephalotus follicularis]|uniref:Zf-CCHC domain-containing protein/Swi3 domain-containing protein n=1 Tax=Cephalotus follicularis TaxID=3775 RepID=A0A1Q3D8W7_CEPFO|nr:zf-CCHC domain-containing protein/Swi3 domain-containing protein [Cephalotus follicularis]